MDREYIWMIRTSWNRPVFPHAKVILLSMTNKKWHDYAKEDCCYLGGICPNKIKYWTLTHSEIVKIQDIYDIVFLINPGDIWKILITLKNYKL